MKKISLSFVLIMILGAITPIFGQESNSNCVDPVSISFPLVKDDLQGKIFYEELDKYTYWYKITVRTASAFTYRLTTINDADNYEMLLYRFDGDNFCNELVHQQLQPTSNKLRGRIMAQKGAVYYFGVLHVNGSGCGHILALNSGNRWKINRAIQNECVEEAIQQIIETKQEVVEVIPVLTPPVIKVEPVVQVEPKILAPTPPTPQTISGIVVNKNNGMSIQANIQVFDQDGNPTLNLVSHPDSGFVIKNYSDSVLIVSITKFGYKTFSATIPINSDPIKIAINPISFGEKLVMHKIYFQPNTAVLKEESKKELLKLSTFMLENSNYNFEIQGHTNGNRTIKKNKRYAHLGADWNFSGSSKKLSKLRAEKIKINLIKNGIQESQLRTAGYGGDKMIVAKPKTMSEAMKNIRVEVIVVQ